MDVVFDALQTIAICLTFVMSMFGWSMIGAGLSFANRRAKSKVWQYGLIGVVVGAVVAGVSFW